MFWIKGNMKKIKEGKHKTLRNKNIGDVVKTVLYLYEESLLVEGQPPARQ